MPSWASRACRFPRENHGKKRDTGAERTSATAFTLPIRSKASKRSAGRLEWPILSRSNEGMVAIGLRDRRFYGVRSVARLTLDSTQALHQPADGNNVSATKSLAEAGHASFHSHGFTGRSIFSVFVARYAS